ncbi:MAG TPA: Asp23/Gls24 family envelope stress response protein [Halanaerobiales bacterium]|nr:Asp23/Gls24 family envelope stress response protein [Halanaerobiales bacterium]
MVKEINTEYGKILIAEEVIETIAGLSAMECYGLVGMSSKNMQDGIADLLGWDNLSKGVSVEIEEDAVNIILNIVVEYGTNIHEVANNIIERVKYTLKNRVGIEVESIEINVQGVRIGNGTE